MEFREIGTELSQLEALSSEAKYSEQKSDHSTLDVVGGAADAAEIEEPVHLTEHVLSPSGPSGEDPVRLYLKEIGKVPLLRAEEEVAIGQRIEAGQIALRRALGSIPLATSTLGALVDRVRREEIPLDDVILLPEGGEPKPDEVKPMLAAVARIRRL